MIFHFGSLYSFCPQTTQFISKKVDGLVDQGTHNHDSESHIY